MLSESEETEEEEITNSNYLTSTLRIIRRGDIPNEFYDETEIVDNKLKYYEMKKPIYNSFVHRQNIQDDIYVSDFSERYKNSNYHDTISNI